MSIKRAIAKARALVAQYGLTLPVDVEGLAERLGIRVTAQALEPHISGLLLRDADAATIVLSARQPRRRRRFTTAHELGHFHLHQGVFINSSVAVNMRAEHHPGSWLQEAEANAFAAELLMPEPAVTELVRAHLKKHPRAAVEGLVTAVAEACEVSEQAANIRLSALGFVQSV